MSDPIECNICYETIGKSNSCVTPCGHAFCFKCMMLALDKKNTCPCCRAVLTSSKDDNDEEEIYIDHENAGNDNTTEYRVHVDTQGVITYGDCDEIVYEGELREWYSETRSNGEVKRILDDKFPHGNGKMWFSDTGSCITGKWDMDILIFGTMVSPDGSQYSGQWQEFPCYWPEGSITNDSKNKKRRFEDGLDVFRTKMRTVFKFHGAGAFTYPDGTTFTGTWKNGHRCDNKYGIMRLPNGDVYQGSWKRGKRWGYGSMIVQGEKYQGEWKNDKRHGYGVIEYENRDMYTGCWFNGEEHGNGRMILSSGTIIEGYWENGAIVSVAKIFGRPNIDIQQILENAEIMDFDMKDLVRLIHGVPDMASGVKVTSDRMFSDMVSIFDYVEASTPASVSTL